MVQWLGIRLPMQGTRVRAPVREDPSCRGATRPVSHNYWACASGARAPQRGRPRQWEACAPRWRVAPARRNWRKPLHRNEDPTQPKIKKNKKKKNKKFCLHWGLLSNALLGCTMGPWTKWLGWQRWRPCLSHNYTQWSTCWFCASHPCKLGLSRVSVSNFWRST